MAVTKFLGGLEFYSTFHPLIFVFMMVRKQSSIWGDYFIAVIILFAVIIHFADDTIFEYD